MTDSGPICTCGTPRPKAVGRRDFHCEECGKVVPAAHVLVSMMRQLEVVVEVLSDAQVARTELILKQTDAIPAKEVARMVGVSAETVRRNPERYGGWRLPTGTKRPRWRFSRARIEELIQRGAGERTQPKPHPVRQRASKRADLLPIKGKAA